MLPSTPKEYSYRISNFHVEDSKLRGKSTMGCGQTSKEIDSTQTVDLPPLTLVKLLKIKGSLGGVATVHYGVTWSDTGRAPCNKIIYNGDCASYISEIDFKLINPWKEFDAKKVSRKDMWAVKIPVSIRRIRIGMIDLCLELNGGETLKVLYPLEFPTKEGPETISSTSSESSQ